MASDQQPTSSAIAIHGADKWHDVKFTGAGVKIGVIDRGFDGIQEQMGTDLPVPGGVRCYSTFNQFSSDIADCDVEHLHGASVLEAVYDIAPDADYYIASVTLSTFYHTELFSIVNWMSGEGVDVIVYSHVGGWPCPGDGTSIYDLSELNLLDAAEGNGITWVSAAGSRAQDTWSGDFKDDDSDGFHEFAPSDECNGIDIEQTDHPYEA